MAANRRQLDWGSDHRSVHPSPAGKELTKRIAQVVVDPGIAMAVRHSRTGAAKTVNMISYTKHIDFQVAKRGPSEKRASEAKGHYTCLDNR
jgi:hypothetical protein